MVRSARILVVDDEPNTLTTLRRALELEGYLVATAGTVREAKERLRDGRRAVLARRAPARR
jgi:DNA-binding NtrC family response regulator